MLYPYQSATPSHTSQDSKSVCTVKKKGATEESCFGVDAANQKKKKATQKQKPKQKSKKTRQKDRCI
jgi:hypothetical protein